MDAKKDIREFLTTRRARITPQQAGLPRYGDTRRVPGLRREEVAMLSGVSVDYYTKLERGNIRGASDSVLDAIARALRLDEVERTHLFDLARACTRPRRTTSRGADGPVRPSVLRVLSSLTTPAYIRNHRLDVLAANDLGFALYDGILTPDRLPMNLARFIFFNPAARDFFLEWDQVAEDVVAWLRSAAGRNLQDQKMTALVGELATRSEDFGERWGRHNVKQHCTAVKRVHHRVVGDLRLNADALEVTGADLIVISYTSEPGSPDEEALRFLASWATRQEQPSASPEGAASTP